MMADRIIRLIRRLLPLPRRPLTRASAWPLALFLVLFGSLIAVLEARHLLRFAEPLAFLWLLVLPWVWYLHAAGWGGLNGVRAYCALFIRFSLIG